MNYNLNVLIISVISYIVVVSIYYFIYGFYINLEHKKIQLPDLKIFSIVLFMLLTILSVSLVVINMYRNNQANDTFKYYQIDTPEQLDETGIDLILKSLKEQLEPEDGKIYATTKEQSFVLDSNQTIRSMYLQFYILKGTSKVYYRIDYSNFDNNNKQIHAFESDFIYHEDLLTEVNTLDDQLNIFKKINFEHVKQHINYNNQNDFMMIDIFMDHNRNYDINYNGNNFKIDTNIPVKVTIEDSLNSNEYDAVIIQKLVKEINGGYKSNQDYVQYFIKK